MSKRRRLLRTSLPSQPVDHGGNDDGNFHRSNDDGHIDIVIDDAYEWPPEESSWFGNGHLRRPYPSSNLMILRATTARARATTTATETKEFLPPVILSFLASIGKLPESQSKDPEQNEQGQNNIVQLAAIDDPRHSTLTTGQHNRYLALLSTWRQNSRIPNNNHFKEFCKLQALVNEEQRHYRKALYDFWEANKERVLTGFQRSPSSSSSSSLQRGQQSPYYAAKFVQAAAYPEPVRKCWFEEFKGIFYGKCCQVLSLEHPSKVDHGTNKLKSLWTVDGIKSHAVSVKQGTDQCDVDWTPTNQVSLPPLGSQVPVPTKHSLPIFLKNDKRAFMLAKSNNVSIVTSIEVLEIIMNACDEDTQWMLPIHFHDDIAIVDLPLPQPFLSPRACLTKGLEEGMMQGIQKSSLASTGQDGKRSHRFVLLTLPWVSAMMGGTTLNHPKQTRILVRVPNQSTRIHAHVEYFPERGEEIPSSYERSLWILDHFLQFSQSVVGRIDPSSCRVTKWEQTSLAHALAGVDDNTPSLRATFPSASSSSSPQAPMLGSQTSSHNMPDNNEDDQDPMQHWHRLSQLLQAIPSIGQREGQYLVCLPGKQDKSLSSPHSATVHKRTDDTANSNEDVAINVELELSHAGEVLLGTAARNRSMRDWNWEEERVPFTFPPSALTKGKSNAFTHTKKR